MCYNLDEILLQNHCCYREVKMPLKSYSAEKPPIKVFGMPLLYETGEWRKLPEWVLEQVPRLGGFRYTATGVRVGFRTNAEAFTVRCTMSSIKCPADHSSLSLTGISVYAGDHREARYLGYLCKPTASEACETFENTFTKGSGLEDVTLFLSSRGYIKQLEILVDDNAVVCEPTPYSFKSPIVFYGSSITAGGAASRAANNYVSLLSRWLDADIINLGFAGNARGDIPVAQYIKNLDMTAFVYDYDHNAPTPDALRDTHKPFFDIIRDAHPDLPIIMLTRPYGDTDPTDTARRREVVYDTYMRAVADGDKNVYFIDGQTMFGEEDRHACTVDLIHPNDLGFMRMAKSIMPVLAEALEKKNS